MINNSPLISVIIPCFNRGYCLRKCINSVLKQTYTNIECIIIDNYSTDETDEIISSIKDERLKLHKIRNNGIIAKSRNLGIKYSKGEIIAFLDSDDWWEGNKVELCIKEINLGADFVYHDLKIRYPLSKNNFLKKRFIFSKKITGNPFKYLINNGNPIPLSSSLLRKEILINAGSFDENKNLIGGEDYFLWINISLRKCNFKRLSLALGYYSINEDAVTSSEKCRTYFKEIFRNLYKSGLVKNKKVPSWCYFSLSYIYLKEGNYLYSFKNLIKSFLTLNINHIYKSFLLFIIFMQNIFFKKSFYSIIFSKMFKD